MINQVVKGPCQLKSYGLYAAERMGFPKDVLECAHELREILSNSGGSLVNVSQGRDIAQLQVR